MSYFTTIPLRTTKISLFLVFFCIKYYKQMDCFEPILLLVIFFFFMFLFGLICFLQSCPNTTPLPRTQSNPCVLTLRTHPKPAYSPQRARDLVTPPPLPAPKTNVSKLLPSLLYPQFPTCAPQSNL